ncbi:hypothetical protein P8452_48357 [Trifolium repens]|nr:hypothetical protein P8452_48357 [Trifolium repens]
MHHFLIARFTHRTIHHSTVLCHNAFPFFFNSRYFSLSNTNHNQQDHSFKLSTIVNSSGLSPESVLKLSERLQIKNPNGPNAVIQILRSYGFSDSDLSKLVKKHPFA